MILPPEVYKRNGTARFNPCLDKQKINRDGDRKDGKIAEHLEYITSNGIESKVNYVNDPKRRGRYCLKK